MDSTATTKTRFRWHSDWRTTLFALVFLPVFFLLGSWQLDRAAEKQAIAERWQLRQLEAPQALHSLPRDAKAVSYRRVHLQGQFLAGRDFLLDNRIYGGRYGLELVSPLRPADGGALVLVNRGWIEADSSRRSLPVWTDLEGPQTLTGTVYVPPGEPYVLGNPTQGSSWPRVAQALDIAAFEALLGEPVFPYSVRLDADSPAALTVDWPLVNISPDKHRAYAAQWFSMAAVLLLIYIWSSCNIGLLLRESRERRQHRRGKQ
jgi:surfeit locus 1 family protein